MQTTLTLLKWRKACLILIFVTGALGIMRLEASFIRNFLEEIDALNTFNETNRKLLYELVTGTFISLTNPENQAQDYESEQMAIERAIESFTFANIAGEIPQDVLEVVHFIKYPEYFTRLGARAPKGILMYGPPGTGKTSLARAIAGEAGATFFHACASEFMEVYVGIGPQRVRELFEKAKKEPKAIIFIDELDAIAQKRDRNESNDERLRTLTELLNQMDGFDQSGNITVIAATNRVQDLDKAILRPGRFDRLVEIPLPNTSSREAIIRLYCSKIYYNGPEYFFSELAARTTHFSGAELQNLVNEAAVLAARAHADAVTPEHLATALKKIVQQKQKTHS